MKASRRKPFLCSVLYSKKISTTARQRGIRELERLSNRRRPTYQREFNVSIACITVELILTETQLSDLLSLQWASPPENILLVKKHNTPQATRALIEFAQSVVAPSF